MNLLELFDEQLVHFDFEAESSDELLEKMVDHLEKRNLVKDTYRQAVIEREHKFPTGLPTKVMSIAIPHTDVVHVNQSCISIARLKKAVPFREMGNANNEVEVNLVFMLALNGSQDHLKVIQKLISLFSLEDVMKDLQKASSKKELLDTVFQAIHEMEII
ncbi:PTS sugar transporter subunit IIA [Oceanobacillus oncorhynchi]|uniref:PTS sugar transporter subunit IIA n=1 Tax=Oceanobacillus oncorhynchi TaxID=545501 RepID=UPI0021167010|nr:PTS sugar transporter subunit IIA [Oceanobacillus oncorhynchi]UUI40676.1 PTS sugar transporter subunit IIA [Oceanobacillus oncorhynchi]